MLSTMPDFAEKKYLIVCSDIGPLKYILKIAYSLHLRNCLFYLSSLAQQYAEDNCIDLKLLNCFPNPKFIKVIITGTTLDQSSIDRKALQWGKDSKIFTISVIEHWSWYRKRFLVQNKNHISVCFPDLIFVNDQIAFNDSIKEGIPPDKLKIMGNPYLESLRFRALSIQKRNTLLTEYNLPLDKYIILFISEEIDSVFSPFSQDSLGYTEYQVLEDLIKCQPKSSHIVIKLHPEESEDKYKNYKDITCITRCPLDHTALLPDKIIGMASMLLIELSAFRNDIISHRPSATKCFVGETLGLTVPSTNRKELKNLFNQDINAFQSIDQLFFGSQEKICKFLKRF